MPTHPTIYVGQPAVAELIRYCRERSFNRFMLVADQNTYPALGQAAELALRAEGWDVRPIVLHGDEVIADAAAMMQVLVHADDQARVYLAVGSGTITDITRFVSHRTRAPFIALPTAPSVDGYASIGAPLVFDGLKQTVACQSPIAIFADLAVLAAAPRRMIASGFGDLIGKLTSAADWQLGHVLWNERYDEAIAQRARDAAWNGVRQIEAIACASEEGVRLLMAGLIETGLCMLDFGQSHPASGGEHHMSHFWELKLLRENRPAILHGLKVGIASIETARLYDRVRRLSRDQAANLLAVAQRPDRTRLAPKIRSAYGAAADQVMQEQSAFLDMSATRFDQLKQHIVEQWEAVETIAATVPAPQQIAAWLRQVGAPTDGKDIGLSDEEVALAVEYGPYLRNRFTVIKLSQLLGF